MDSFYDRVYEVVRLIPSGRVCTYGAIARYLGTGKSARMVGYAMRHAGNARPPVPAHRVVNSSGLLSGKQAFASPSLMQELLESEVLKIKNDKVLNFRSVLWLPGTGH